MQMLALFLGYLTWWHDDINKTLSVSAILNITWPTSNTVPLKCHFLKLFNHNCCTSEIKMQNWPHMCHLISVITKTCRTAGLDRHYFTMSDMSSLYAGHSDLQAKSWIFEIWQSEAETIMRGNSTNKEITLISLPSSMNVMLSKKLSCMNS